LLRVSLKKDELVLGLLDYSVCDILQELVYEGRREPFANLKDLQNVIKDKWHDVDDQTVRKAILLWKRRLAAVAKFKAEWRTYSAHFLLTSWLMITVTFWCSLRTSDNINDEPLANIVLWRVTLFRLYHGFCARIPRHNRRCLLITHVLFCWFISTTLLHNAMRMFETFFCATRYVPINGFWAVLRAKVWKYCVLTPNRHYPAWMRVCWCIACQNRFNGLGPWKDFAYIQTNKNWVANFGYTGRSNHWGDLDQFNVACGQIWWT